MGLLWSSAKYSPIYHLESVTDKIDMTEERIALLDGRQSKVCDALIMYGIGLYLTVGTYIYCFYIPTDKRRRQLFYLCYVGYPILLILLKFLLAWVYQTRKKRAERHLMLLQAEKSRIMDQLLMEEPYRTFLGCLERMDKERGVSLGKELRSRLSQRQLMESVQPQQQLQQHQGSLFDKLCDLIIGDGSDNRYALICCHCRTHNGMALKEEFEYIGFKCAFCRFFNPARKARPPGPKLELVKPGPVQPLDSSSEDEIGDRAVT